MKTLAQWRTRQKADVAVFERCKQAIQQVAPGSDVILHGSRARGDAAPDSDYDLLVVVPGDVTPAVEDSILDALFPIELETGAVLSFIALSRDVWESPRYRVVPLRLNVEREGVLL